MPGGSLTPRGAAIVAAAGELLDEEGPDALTMRRLAERTGLKASSLYRHLPGKGSIEAALIVEALEDAADALRGRGGREPVGPARSRSAAPTGRSRWRGRTATA